MARLRLGLSHLLEHNFNPSFQSCMNPLYSCGMDIESSSNFFSIVSYLMLTNHSPEHLETNESSLTENLRFGNSLFYLERNCFAFSPLIAFYLLKD